MKTARLWFLIILSCHAISCKSQESTVWEDFKAAQKNGREPILPDFSYAGYKYSEESIPYVKYKVFNVMDYGAIPNDAVSDKSAIIKAISKASDNGKGIVFFPIGKYLINTGDDELDPIVIPSSHIVFRGEKNDFGEAVLYFENDLPEADPKKMWTCPYAIKTIMSQENTFLTEIVADAKRETYEVTVASAANIKVGDWVIISLQNNDNALVRKDIHPLAIDPKWTAIIDKGVVINERHQVASVNEKTVTFKEPIHYTIEDKYDWKLQRYAHLEEIGFENLVFEGNWKKEFIHHRSAQDDGGWSILNLSKVVNSWVKDCTFKNVNRALSISGSAATTALNITIDGTIGHNGVSASGGSTNILLANINDKAGMHHTTGVGGGSTTGTVIWRSKHPPHTSFESHASQPRCTLIDNVEGGFFSGRAGGSVKNLPNHGRHLVLWNYMETDSAETNFSFVAKDSEYWRIVPPIIVGFHGAGTTFNTDEVQLLESLGKPVKPESLFEEQLKLRLGKLPNWIIEEKNRIAK